MNKTNYFGDTPALNTERNMTKLALCSWKNVDVISEAVTQSRSVRKVFLEISQNSQKNKTPVPESPFQ